MIPVTYRVSTHPVVDIVLDGKALLGVISEAVNTDPAPVALFPERSVQEGRYFERDESDCVTTVTLTFTGAEALRAREIVATLLKRA